MKGHIQELFAGRLGGPSFGLGDETYKFARIKRAKAEAQAARPDVDLLDFGVGEPDEMADRGVVEALQREVEDPENRGYADNGLAELNEAAAAYLERAYGVGGIDPATEVVHTIGAKSALAMLPAAFIDPGDACLITVPGYPVLGTHSRWLGGEVVNLPLEEKNGFRPDLDAVAPAVARRAKLLYINYPNNPTGAGATPEFFARVVEFARRYRLVVVHDAAYAPLTFGERLSFLSIEGAKSVGIELHSCSKAFNMTGWRLAFAAGNSLVIKGLAEVKDNCDSGQFKAIQKAAINAFAHPEISDRIVAKLERRLELMVQALTRTGFKAKMPAGTFYLYVPAPRVLGGREFADAAAVSDFLIREKLISTVPWDDAGAYLRFSATFIAPSPADEEAVAGELESRLADLDPRF